MSVLHRRTSRHRLGRVGHRTAPSVTGRRHSAPCRYRLSAPPVIVVGKPAAQEEPQPDLETSGNVLKGRAVRFWEIEWEAETVYIEYGRVDREPKTQTKSFLTRRPPPA